MDELGDLLELMHVARARFSSIEARMGIRYDSRVLRDAARSWGPLRLALEGGPGIQVATRTDHVWFISDARYRVESESLGPRFVHVKNGERASWPDPVQITAGGSYEEVAFLNEPGAYRQVMWDPNILIPEMSFEPLGRQVVGDREGLRVRALPRWTSHDYIVVPPWADAYQLVVDLERGVLLQFGCWFQGHEGVTDEVLEISFDRPLPDELFAI